MKKIFIALLTAILLIGTTACSSSSNTEEVTTTTAETIEENTNINMSATEKSDSIQFEYEEYCKDNLKYHFDRISAEKSENNSYKVFLQIIDTPKSLQSFSKEALEKTNNFFKSKKLKVESFNTVVLSDVEVYFGWATNGVLYSYETYPIARNVDVDNITQELSKVVDLDKYDTVKDKIYADDDEIIWEVISTQNYVRDSKKCIAYRVYINVDNASDSQLLNIYEEATKDDGYYLHTVWFYYDKTSANGSGTAKITIEQTINGIDPINVIRN